MPDYIELARKQKATENTLQQTEISDGQMSKIANQKFGEESQRIFTYLGLGDALVYICNNTNGAKLSVGPIYDEEFHHHPLEPFYQSEGSSGRVDYVNTVPYKYIKAQAWLLRSGGNNELPLPQNQPDHSIASWYQRQIAVILTRNVDLLFISNHGIRLISKDLQTQQNLSSELSIAFNNPLTREYREELQPAYTDPSPISPPLFSGWSGSGFNGCDSSHPKFWEPISFNDQHYQAIFEQIGQLAKQW